MVKRAQLVRSQIEGMAEWLGKQAQSNKRLAAKNNFASDTSQQSKDTKSPESREGQHWNSSKKG